MKKIKHFTSIQLGVEKIGLSPLVLRMCKIAGISTLEELLDKITDPQIAKMFGNKSQQEIRSRIRKVCGISIDKSFQNYLTYQKTGY